MAEGVGAPGGIAWLGPPPGWLGEARAVLSLRGGGVSCGAFDSLNLGHSVGDAPVAVVENEKRLSEILALPTAPARTRLEHGTRMEVVDRPGLYGPVDALATERPDLPLWITVGDCFPVYLILGEWIALVHAGWRSIAGGIAGRVAADLAPLSRRPTSQVRVWIGAGVGPCCYPVASEVAERFPAACRSDGPKPIRLDLAAAVRADLRQAGVPPEAIAASSLCTACHPELFFSHRRDGPRTGRMAAVLWRPVR